MLSSHELAKILLSHRDTDLLFDVLIENYEDDLKAQVIEERLKGCEPGNNVLIRTRDSDDEVPAIDSNQVVTYNSLSDALIIRLGTIDVLER